MKLKFIIIFIALIISCDENINDPSSYKQDFLPLTVGSYWIYEFHKLDMNRQIIDSSQYIDSLVVEKKEFVENNLYTFYLVFYKNGFAYDTLFLRKKNNQIFFYVNPDINVKGFSRRWLPLINLNMKYDETWNIFNNQIYDYIEELNGQEYKGTYYITDNGRLVSIDSILFNDNLFFSKYFNHKYDSRLQFLIFDKRYIDENTYIIDTFVYNKIYQYTEEYRLLQGVGLSHLRKNPHRLIIFTNPSSTISYSQDFLGWERILLRYDIKD